MGTLSALMALRVAINLEKILAIELLTARAALRFLRPLSPTPRLRQAVDMLDSLVPPITEDRMLGPDITLLADYLGAGGSL